MTAKGRILSAAAIPLLCGAFVATGFAVDRLVAGPGQAPVRVRPPAPPAAARARPPRPAMPEAKNYTVKRILKIKEPMHLGDYYWDEAGAPAGQVVITVDLAAKTLSIFRAGYEIGTAGVIYGAPEKPTPLGIFPITQKDATHISTLYNAPMPYMLRMTNDGITIHGSDKMGDQYVTHGCVGIPIAFAKKLFGAVKLGDKVIVTRGERLKIGGAITAA